MLPTTNLLLGHGPEPLSLVPCEQQAVEAPRRSSSSLGARRSVSIEPLTNLSHVFARPSARCESTATADFGGDLEPPKTTPTFRSITPISAPSQTCGDPLFPMPGCVESPKRVKKERDDFAAPEADAAAGAAGIGHVLLMEQRERHRQMEEWMRQLMLKQEQLMRHLETQRWAPISLPPSLHLDASEDASPRPRLRSGSSHEPRAAPDLHRGKSIDSGITSILQNGAPSPTSVIAFERNVSTADTNQSPKSPTKTSGWNRQESPRIATEQSMRWVSKGSGSQPGSPTKKSPKTNPEEEEEEDAEVEGSPSARPPVACAASFVSTPASEVGSRTMRRRSTIDLFRVITTPKRAPRKLLSRGSTLNLETSSPLQIFVHSKGFSAFSIFLIVANNCWVAYELDCNTKNEISRLRTTQHDCAPSQVGLAMVLVMLIEMLLRVVADQRLFFTGPERHWNNSDLTFVLLGLLEQIFKGIWGTSFALPNMTAGRILRTVNLLKSMHVPGMVKTMHNMRLMMFLILGSAAQLLRALVILFFVIYIFALVFMYGLVRYLETSSMETARIQDLEANFGNFGSAIMCLFMAASGGDDWQVYWRDASELGWMYGVLFAFYIAFVVIGVLNVVTGVFVDSAWQMAQADRDVAVAEAMAHKETYIHDLREIFLEADADESGSLSWDEFKEHLKDERVKAYLSSLELDVTQARGLFKLLDTNQREEVSIDDFVSGCMRLKGQAKSIDVCTLLYENRKMARSFSQNLRELKMDMRSLDKKLKASAEKKPPPASGTRGVVAHKTEPPSLPPGALPDGFRVHEPPPLPSLEQKDETRQPPLEEDEHAAAPSRFNAEELVRALSQVDDDLSPSLHRPRNLSNLSENGVPPRRPSRVPSSTLAPRPETPFSAVGGFGPWGEDDNDTSVVAVGPEKDE